MKLLLKQELIMDNNMQFKFNIKIFNVMFFIYFPIFTGVHNNTYIRHNLMNFIN